MNERKVYLYIAMSLDGYIASSDDGLEFLSIVEQEGEDYGYSDFIKEVDTIIIGRKTYDKVISMGFPYPGTDKEVYIISRKARPAEGNKKYYGGNLATLVAKLKSEPGKNIFCDGGAEIVNELLRLRLIDEIIISVIPVLLGNGIPLFKAGRPDEQLELRSVRSFNKGLVQLHFRVMTG